MSIRTFRDERGRIWQAWTVAPTYFERRFVDAPEDDPPVIERRKQKQFRIKIDREWVNGWLAFETAGEKRRLPNFPENWHLCSEQELMALCTQALPVTTTSSRAAITPKGRP